MFYLLARYWGLMILRGFLSVLMSFVALTFPTLSLDSLTILLSTFLVVDGALILWVAVKQQNTVGWKTHLLEGLTGLVFGSIILVYPQPTIGLVMTSMAGWTVVTGLIKIWSALHMPQEADDEFWLGLSGVFGVAFGVLLLVFPADVHTAAVTAIGAYSLITGTILGILGLSLRQHLKDIKYRLTHLFL